jgi:hypothetical protein
MEIRTCSVKERPGRSGPMTGATRWQSGDPGRARVRDVAGLITTWSVWGALTVALLLFVRQYSRNVPDMDDFAMVPVMTGSEAVTWRWA